MTLRTLVILPNDPACTRDDRLPAFLDRNPGDNSISTLVPVDPLVFPVVVVVDDLHLDTRYFHIKGFIRFVRSQNDGTVDEHIEAFTFLTSIVVVFEGAELELTDYERTKVSAYPWHSGTTRLGLLFVLQAENDFFVSAVAKDVKKELTTEEIVEVAADENQVLPVGEG